MKKQIAFCKKDEELIKKIVAFQEEKRITFFIDAVRLLCNEALDCNVNVQISLKKEK